MEIIALLSIGVNVLLLIYYMYMYMYVIFNILLKWHHAQWPPESTLIHSSFPSSTELPVIDEITDPIRVVEEETATIPVSVTGLPDPMVQFIRDGEVLTNGSRITVGERELVISDVDMEDRGFYSIRANNSAGVDTHTRTLLVECTFRSSLLGFICCG